MATLAPESLAPLGQPAQATRPQSVHGIKVQPAPDGGVETGGGAKAGGWYKTTQLQPQNNPGFVKLNGGRSHGNEENFFQNLTGPSFLPTLGCVLLPGYALSADVKNIEL